MSKIFMSGHGEDDDYRKGARKVKRKNSPLLIAIFGIFMTASAIAAVYFSLLYVFYETLPLEQQANIKKETPSLENQILQLKKPEESAEKKQEQKDPEKSKEKKSPVLILESEIVLPTISKPAEKEAVVIIKTDAAKGEEKIEVKIKKTTEKKRAAGQKKTEPAVLENEDFVKKGEGVFKPAKRIKEKMRMSYADFWNAWFNTKILINGREVNIEEIGLVPKKTKIIYDKVLKIFWVVPPRGAKLGTYRDLYSIYKSRKKAVPEWLLSKIGILGHEIIARKPYVIEKKEMVEPRARTEKKIITPKFPPISPRLLEERKKLVGKPEKPEIKAERKIIKKYPLEARKLIAPKIKTKTETEILLEKGIARSEIPRILDLKNIINENLAVKFSAKFSALEIYEQFYKYNSGLKIRPYLDEDERGILLEKGDITFFLKESGRITMSKDLNNFLSLLRGKPVYAVLDFKTFSAGDLDKVKENILERYEKETRLFYILDEVRRKRFRLDVLREDLRNMLYYEDFRTVIKSGWASRRKFGYEQASAKSIVEFLRNYVVRNSDIELDYEDFDKKVGDVLSENIDAVLLKAQRKFN